MGSNSSKGKKHQDASQYGQIYLKTDKTAYYAGETVTGTISLNLISHYPGNQLFLKFKGIEAAHFVQEVRRDDKTDYIMRSEKQDIIKQKTPVYLWDTLLPGQYTIPFSFLLPQTVPYSFYQQGERYLAYVEYRLEAFLEPHQDINPRLKYKQPINLRETIKPITGDLPSNVTTPLKTCCCCKQGSNTLKVNFEKNFYSPGENAQVSMELDNSGTSLKNLKVVLSLKQKLELRAAGNTQTFDLVKVKQELPGIPKKVEKNAGSLSIVLPNFPSGNEFKRELDKNPTTWGLMRLSETKNVITSTTESSLITSTFYLEVSCPMSGCCATLPQAQCPIGIVSPDFLLPIVNAPNNWQPLILDNITLAFPYDQNQPLQNGMVQKNPHQFNNEMVQFSSPNHLQPNQMPYNS